MDPETGYARLGGEQIAYQVVGEGPPDLVLSAGTFGSIDLDWEDPMVAGMYRRLGAFCRLIRFDRRGSGASDPVPRLALPPWESYVEEVVAVMHAVESPRAAIMGMFDAGPMAALFAATKPEQTVALILANTSARLLRAEDYPTGVPRERAAAAVERIERTWGTEEQARMQVPSRASDPHFRRWFARYTRSIATPAAVRVYLEAMLEADARSILPTVHVPTLVLHRAGYELFAREHGRFLADHIDGATYVELAGSDGPLPWEDADRTVDVIEQFLTGSLGAIASDRALATVLFTDIVQSTERAGALGDDQWRDLLDLHDDTARRLMAVFQGRVVETTGDGILATFDGPGRAIRAAAALREDLRRLGLEIRAGVHTGEIELRGDGIGGIAVHIAARVMAAAQPGETFVSRTVRDVTFGSEIRMDDRGLHRLKGVAGDWQLFAVTRA